MKSRKTSLKDLMDLYNHPSAYLFRAIELGTIYEKTQNMEFKQPSLDLGCGDGKIAEMVFDDKFTYGVDNGEANDYQMAIEKKRYEKVLLESAEKMSLSANTVNFVFSNSVVEHIPNEDAVISEVSRILKPGGIYLFTAPSKYFGLYLFFSKIFYDLHCALIGDIYIKYRNKMLNHYHLYDIETWEEKLNKHGLKVLDYTYYLESKVIFLWDIMAWFVFIGRLVVGERVYKFISNIFEDKIKSLYERSKLLKKEGGGILVICTKE